MRPISAGEGPLCIRPENNEELRTDNRLPDVNVIAREAVVWFFQGMLCGFIHVDFTLQNRPLPFTEKCEKGSGLVVLSENQDFNFFGKKLAITKEKALNPLRFKAFGAARQIRTDKTASRTMIFHIRKAVFLLFQGVFLFFDDALFGGKNVVKGKWKGNF